MASQPWRVLLVEDEPGDALLFAEALDRPNSRPRWEVVHVTGLVEARARLEEPFHLIALDLGLPGSRGEATLERVLGWEEDLPVVVVTGMVDADLGSSLIALGAEDFVSKDELASGQLHRILEHAVVRHRARPAQPTQVAVGEIAVRLDGELLPPVRFGKRGARVGRTPDNHVHIDDRRVSRHHALIWVEQGAAWVEDLGSSNGTLVDGQRIEAPTALAEGQEVGFGQQVSAVVTLLDPAEDPRLLPVSAPVPELELPEPEDTEAEDGMLPYTVDASLSGPAGCRARVDGPHGRTTVEADTRVSLLFVLAQKLAEDRAEGVDPADAGWLTNWEAAVAIWGRRHAEDQTRSALSVLLHRVRRELEDGGVRPDIVERRRGALRLRARHVVLRE